VAFEANDARPDRGRVGGRKDGILGTDDIGINLQSERSLKLIVIFRRFVWSGQAVLK